MATHEEIKSYLTQHQNWVETAPDRFEACIESDLWPVRIELDEVGAAFTFSCKAVGNWSFLAGHTRRAAYQMIHIDDETGCLLVDIQVAILPNGTEPARADGNSPRISYQIKLPPDLPDGNPYPDVTPPE